MPNGIDWKKIARDRRHPVEKIKINLKYFAYKHNLKLYFSTYHDGLFIEFSTNKKSKNNRYYIYKRILLKSCNLNDKIVCRVYVRVNINYGMKEFFYFIPFLNRVRKTWLRKEWLCDIGYLDFPLDSKKLLDLFTHGKQVLDNFDEEILHKEKSDLKIKK